MATRTPSFLGKGKTMTHPIEFRWLALAEIDGPEYGLRQGIVITEGTRLSAKVKPYVAESPDGPIEMVDLYLDDSSVVRAVRRAAFQFLDGSKCDEPACRGSCSIIAEE
jgi:hypothetical protein